MKKNQEVNNQTTLEKEAESILEMGMNLLNESDEIFSAAFFQGPKGRHCWWPFDFNYKTNPYGVHILRNVVDDEKSTRVIITSCATLHDGNNWSWGETKSKKNAIVVYSENKNTSLSIAQEFKRDKNGRIRFSEKRVLLEGDVIGHLTGILNTKLRLENEAKIICPICSSLSSES